MPVKIKFNAFPFQRFGFIDGVLDLSRRPFLPPAITRRTGCRSTGGEISLARDYFTSPETGARIPLRFGMIAIAEIMVQQRRLLDGPGPLRRASG